VASPTALLKDSFPKECDMDLLGSYKVVTLPPVAPAHNS
jgi:hypothetical protein